MQNVALVARVTPSELVLVNPDDGELILYHDGCAPEVMQKRIAALVDKLMQAPERLDLRVEHTFNDGMYMRKLFIPKGSLVVGKVHLMSCMNIVAKGDVSILTKFGCKRLSAGFTGPSSPGIQRVALAHEDSVFINVFRTSEEPLDRVEAKIGYVEPVSRDAARADYAHFLLEYGIDDDAVQAVVADMSDHADMPVGFRPLEVRRSPIHGVGVFTVSVFMAGDWIGPARIGGKRTYLGRRTNHSPAPNCRFEEDSDGGMSVYALRDIPPREELTVDYRQAARANRALGLEPVKEMTCPQR